MSSLKSPVMSEEDVISLIVKCYRPFTTKLRIKMEQRCQHSGYRMSKPGSKIVQDDFRSVLSNFFPVSANVFGNLDIAQFEVGRRTIRQVSDDESIR